ncbi:hypothetical protein D0544_12085 [Aestuariirhabdus litorea]|uniref:Uncharacterized protein n=2 Tax=Aestuariirhabdus litorea TaxID=2528527 RepID=A0A3P3VL44_9GAMM|nr:hypothetical protein D0544_12085 [Aestuariirhabdus litorea]
MPTTTQDLIDQLAAVASNPAVSTKAIQLTKKYLGQMIYTSGEEVQIAEDALQTVLVKALIAIKKGTSSLLDSENPKDSDAFRSEVEKYIIKGVKNYLKTRAARWSVDKHSKSTSTTDANAQPSSTKSGLKSVAARARHPILSDSPHASEFWDSRLSTAFDSGDDDLESVQSYLEKVGLSSDEIDVILGKLAGKTFVEMAEDLGGSQDKYRKIYSRALKKAGIPVD